MPVAPELAHFGRVAAWDQSPLALARVGHSSSGEMAAFFLHSGTAIALGDIAMTRTLLSIAAVAAALFACPAFAQSDTAGESRAAHAKPTTKAERAEARKARQAAGKKLGQQDHGRLEDEPKATTGAKTYTPQEKDAARKARLATGKELGKQDAGRIEDHPAAR